MLELDILWKGKDSDFAPRPHSLDADLDKPSAYLLMTKRSNIGRKYEITEKNTGIRMSFNPTFDTNLHCDLWQITLAGP